MINSLEPQLKENASKIHNFFQGKVPYVQNEPIPEDYELPNDWEPILEKETLEAKRRGRYIFRTSFMVLWISVMFFSDIEEEESMKIVLLLVESFVVLLWFFYVLLIVTGIDERIKRRYIKTPIKIKADQYINDKKAFMYWRYQRQTEFWNSLNGYEFEQYVGQVFTKNKYKVQQTKLSGDGGIDLILEKNDEKTAVQCKAHRKAVGPSVVRDLYGTMNHFGYKKGMLVSLNGFTSGVYSFVKDKEISLISVHELIEMCDN